MKRIRMVGLCLVAVFALGAIVSTAAQAAAPEWGRCVAQKKGEYTNASCTTKSVKAKKGVFEFVAGPAPSCVPQKKGEYTNNTCTIKSVKAKKGTFEKAGGPGNSSVGGSATLETPALAGPVTCTANTALGEITGAKTAKDQIKFTTCETEGKVCTSFQPGLPAGTIETPNLTVGLTEPKGGEIQYTFVGEGGLESEFSSEFSCGAGVLEVRTHGLAGGVIAPAGVNVMTTKNELNLQLGEGTQGLLTEASANGGVTWTPPGGSPSIEKALGAKITNNSSMEIKS